MLNKTQLRAVDMLFSATDEEISSVLRIKKETLDAWKDRVDFNHAINRRMKDNLDSAMRLLSQICADSCRELESLIKSNDSKDKPRAIIEVLKASGLFKNICMHDTDELNELIERITDGEEDIESGETA